MTDKREHLQRSLADWRRRSESDKRHRESEIYLRNRLACPRKVKHRTIEEAEREAVRMRAEHNQPFDVYECAFCHYFHVGRPSYVKHPRTQKGTG